MKSKEEKLRKQTELQERCQSSGINIVNCGQCGSVMLHEINEEDVECPFCNFKSEPCDFPDYFYQGFELSGEFKEEKQMEKSIKEKIEQSFEWCRMTDKHDNFVKEEILGFEPDIKDVSAFHSGGGCFHMLFQLQNGRILLYHSEEATLEITHVPYESCDYYLSIDEDERGLGWEYMQPDYWRRSFSVRNWNQVAIRRVVKELIEYEYEPPKVVITMEGGVITHIGGDETVRVLVVDYDVDEDSRTVDVPQSGTDKVEPARVWEEDVEILNQRVEQLFDLNKEKEEVELLVTVTETYTKIFKVEKGGTIEETIEKFRDKLDEEEYDITLDKNTYDGRDEEITEIKKEK